MLQYYITDRQAYDGSIPDLLQAIERVARSGVDMIQVRERDLPVRALLRLVQAALEIACGTKARILVNDRVDVALAAGAHGVHLRSNGIAPRDWRRVVPTGFLLGRSCHTVEEIKAAREADFVVFGPVFDSPSKGPGVGLEALRAAAASSDVPVLALGGITEATVDECLAHGAAGIAGIRLFQA
jgi:thiamine-phosphate pyrophosphorylase